ncbi:plastocyanin/azurin family copper-binding protein [Tepidiforma bonchosmolovskayae]|uniref:Blue (type 1) copper domain-containing protein n=1 Tax=Tepidiforma bonchosmolovskayae TaxID=2601677 RepID=A0ABX6C4S2_9CHLR|nr:plastocyanin/azurin family copper-binding protein [Tepidiforma bonchosmolovskayae]QFG03235.1 hypothetical protein Tbon_07980 [Tepidiforma bonchosmolovskayae]
MLRVPSGARSAMAAALLVAGIAAGLGAGCGGDDDDSTTQLNAELVDWGVKLDRTSVPAGDVRVKAKNTGSTEHELVFVRTDLPEDKLPVKDNKVDEEQVEVVGEIEKFPAGKSESATLTLPAGRYVVICNVATHYGLGMHTVLQVQ